MGIFFTNILNKMVPERVFFTVSLKKWNDLSSWGTIEKRRQTHMLIQEKDVPPPVSSFLVEPDPPYEPPLFSKF